MIEVPPPFDNIWLRAALGFVIGTIFGSFITALSYRWPRKISVIMPPSFCSKCHQKLAPRDLVPVFSWLINRGKCRFCHDPISIRYLWIEIATGIPSAIAFAWISFQPMLIPAVLIITAIVTVITIRVERD